MDINILKPATKLSKRYFKLSQNVYGFNLDKALILCSCFSWGEIIVSGVGGKIFSIKGEVFFLAR